jgi:hypothetical protein
MSPLQDPLLLARFQDSTLPHEQWTHRAHLLVAASYLAKLEPAVALPRLRTEIQHLNLSHGVLTTPDRGYHETLTRVWLALILMARDRLGSEATVQAVVDACVSDKNLPLRYYSKDRLMSWQARTSWVPPDLQPLAYDPGEWEEGTPPLLTLVPQP